MTTTYTRSFNKLDDYLSYIGGLIGSALVIFFVLNTYSERCYLIDIASNILENYDSQISLKKFNFIDNIGIMVKNVLETIKIDVNWTKINLMVKAI
jgi:hypothetical protein